MTIDDASRYSVIVPVAGETASSAAHGLETAAARVRAAVGEHEMCREIAAKSAEAISVSRA